ncbi:GyrI-like domain-containing protein [Cohnella nanjingensis]|uniref:GyrI-like domain-containing protein n=1 Tax=Cohnella nanjingensis TaxID=1387779 RepID=A0A7X0RQE4_9BACL|nr:GyrI-like domain-containing protein [Cohnella nanjingensis]MBB6671774.1 GyrI-like domain-containing protein [Cohnella nanjingensis]
MDKIDYKKTNKALYAPSADAPSLVEAPEMRVWSLQGAGDPNTSAAYREAVEALFTLSYGVKFAWKRDPAGADYTVMPLEALYPPEVASLGKAEWRWTLFIRQPDGTTAEMAEAVREEAMRKKKLPALAEAKFGVWNEGLSAQMLHIGSFDEEGPTMARLNAYIREAGLIPNGEHHEIYLSDFRRTEPAKLKTILRQPVRRNEG